MGETGVRKRVSMEDLVVVKLHTTTGDIKRFRVGRSTAWANFVQVLEVDHGVPADGAKLSYVDDEGDHVSFVTQSDLDEMTRCVGPVHVHVKLHISVDKEPSSPHGAAEQPHVPPFNAASLQSLAASPQVAP